MFGKKMLFALCLVIFASIATATQAHAQSRYTAYSSEHTVIEVQPLWDNVVFMTANLLINNGRAVLSGFVIGNHGTTSITVNAVLERVNPSGTFTHIVSFNNIRANGDIWDWETSHHVARGHNYRLTLTATAVRNGFSEVVSLSRTSWAN
jgi:hypothetical protein